MIRNNLFNLIKIFKNLIFFSSTIILVLVFLGINVYKNNEHNFSAEIKIYEDLIYEGEDIYLNIFIKNNSPYKDSIRELHEISIAKNINVINFNNEKSKPLYIEYIRDSEYYSVFEPFEEKIFRVELNNYHNFSGLTPFYTYYPEDNYIIHLNFPINDSLYISSNTISFNVFKNTGRNAELFKKIRHLDSTLKSKKLKYDTEIIDITDNIINEYIEERIVENIIVNNNITKELLNYKFDEGFISENISYLRRNPNLRNTNIILGQMLSYIESKNKENKNLKFNEFKHLLALEFEFNTSFKNKLLNTTDSLLIVYSKDD